MIWNPSRPTARGYIDGLASAGYHHFTSGDARDALGVSAAATKLALSRLARKGIIAQPARGFYVIVPPEYRSLGCLPPEQFIPSIMHIRARPYYAGLLSAAQYHGAAHHRPQQFQVLVRHPIRPIECGRVRAAFVVRKHVSMVPTQFFNTPRGTIRVSTPEATAIDLVGYRHRVGGLDQVATVLAELAAQIDPEKLVSAAQTAPIPWAQRLGYLLSLVASGKRADPLRDYVKQAARQSVPLVPSVSHSQARRDADWKVFVNSDVEPDL
ncbi:MAG: hypothetical protein F4Y47_09450 [Acidobacteriia bacterium]|nr:hypothetical protein [Terriglobia bacterium]MYK10047.1 hypothetical protein [Terriglobia bacterium]